MMLKELFNNLVHEITFPHTVKILARLLIFVVLVGFVIGIVKMVFDFRILVYGTIEDGLRQMLLNALNLFAVIEVVRTGLSYLRDGRVRVRYVVDTVLIVMLNEVIALWFKGDTGGYVPLIAILLTLAVLRVIAIRFSPSDEA